jgi:hypothetical protein
MEVYKSSSNLAQDAQRQLSSLKIIGEGVFKLSPNVSGKSLIKFKTPYPSKPLVQICVSVDSGSILDCSWVVSKLSQEGFELHIMNKDLTNEMVGSYVWMSSPMA